MAPHPLDHLPADEDFPLRFTYPRDPRIAPRSAGPRGLASPLARQVLAAVQQTKEYKFLERMMTTGGLAG
jgi:hypothetical protein